MIKKPFRDTQEYFHAFIRTAQYIPNLTTRQDILSETGRVLVSFFGADLVGFFEPGKDGRIEGHHWILPEGVPGTAILTKETETIITGVLETGFLAAQQIDIPEPVASVFLPIQWENQTAAVMLVGHRTSDPIPKELLNIYLAVAGLVSNAITGADEEFKNIAARKRAEDSLKEARAQLAFLVSNTPVVLYRCSASDFNVTFISDNVRLQLGYETHEFMDDPAFWPDHIHPDDRKHVFDRLPRLIEKGTATSEYRFLAKDGTYRWTRDEVSAVRDANGQPLEFLGYWIDITERKLAEERLERSYAILKGVVESPKEVVIFALDRQYRYIAFNENHRHTMKHIWGADIALGKSMLEYIRNDEDQKKAIINFDRALSGESFTLVEAYGDTALDRRLYEDTYNPITDEQGSVIGLTLFLTDITERKQAEEALRVQNQIFETIAEGVYLIRTRDGVIVYANSKFEKMFGYEKGELIGKHVSVVNAPEEQISPGGTAEEIIKALTEKGEWRGEVKNIRKDGSTFWCLAVVSTFEHPGFGSVWISAHTDITARKRAEEALRESRGKYRDLVENIDEVILSVDLQGTFTYISPVIERLYGYTPEEVTGHQFLQFVHPDDQLHCIEGFRRRLNGDYDTDEFRIITKDDRVHYISVSPRPIEKDGRIVGFNYVMTDITRRRQAEEALRESRQILEAVLNNITVRVFWKDKNLVYLGCNAPFARDAGFEKPEDLIGKDDYAMGWREQAELYRADDRAVIDSGKLKLLFEEPQTTPSGVKIHLLTSKVPLRDAKDEIIGVLGTYLDITAYKRAEEERERIRSWQAGVNRILESVLAPAPLDQKLKIITDGVVETFGADFCRIWLIEKGDLCTTDCMYAEVADGPYVCRYRDKCLHLKASSGRYTHIDGKVHRRVPFGAYKIGRIASGEEMRFLTNDVEHDPRVHNHAWARSLGLVSFSGYLLKSPDSDVLGVFALFARFPITPDMDALLDGLSRSISLAIQKDLADKALRESEQRFRDIFNNTSDAILLHEMGDNGPPGRFTDANEVACRMLGYTREEIFAKTPLEITTDYHNPSVERILEDQRTTGRARFETEYRAKDGTIIPVEINTHVVTLQGNKLMLGAVRDITERKKAAAAILQSEQKFRDIFNNTTDAIHIHGIGDDGTPARFTEVNDVTCRILGYNKEEMLAKTPLEITTDYHNPPVEKILEAQRTTGVARFETEYRRKDGTIMPVEVNTHVVTIQGTKVMLGVVRDITERKQAEEALRQVNKKLNLLSGITRHDINNQLFSLKAFLELSKESLGNAAKMSEYIIKEERAANAIERQIVFTKEYQDLGVKTPGWQNVKASITKALAVLPMRDIRIMAEVNDLEVYADPLFEKVFYNLIDNALRYGGQGMTLIRFLSQESEHGLVISVEDDGEGISAEDKKRLFERGFGHHTGLGLFLSREILSITGITITENGEPGKGARFEILVPMGGYRFTSEN